MFWHTGAHKHPKNKQGTQDQASDLLRPTKITTRHPKEDGHLPKNLIHHKEDQNDALQQNGKMKADSKNNKNIFQQTTAHQYINTGKAHYY